jgi:hypothetical protein
MRQFTRITIDLDTREITPLIRCLKVLRHYGFVKELTVKPSSSGRGFHVKGWSLDKGVTLKKLQMIRAKAGDDPMRIRLDEGGNKPIQVLFTHKTKKELDEWEEDFFLTIIGEKDDG